MPRDVVVLLSGGLDSVCALYDAQRTRRVAAALSFDYAAKHNHRELPMAQHHCAALGIQHEVMHMPDLGRLFISDLLQSGGDIPDGHYEESTMKQTVVPFRNGILLAIAAGFAESIEAGGLVIAAHAGDHAIYPDCRDPFMRAMGEAIRLGTYGEIELLRPFIHFSKSDIVRRGAECGVDFFRTWSCYKGGDVHCGTCGTCVERREAFALAGIADPTPYLTTNPLPSRPSH